MLWCVCWYHQIYLLGSPRGTRMQVEKPRGSFRSVAVDASAPASLIPCDEQQLVTMPCAPQGTRVEAQVQTDVDDALVHENAELHARVAALDAKLKVVRATAARNAEATAQQAAQVIDAMTAQAAQADAKAQEAAAQLVLQRLELRMELQRRHQAQAAVNAQTIAELQAGLDRTRADVEVWCDRATKAEEKASESTRPRWLQHD